MNRAHCFGLTLISNRLNAVVTRWRVKDQPNESCEEVGRGKKSEREKRDITSTGSSPV